MIRTEVAVVGGGVIGLSIAARLAQDGVDAMVIDDAPVSGASGVAAGMLAPVTEVHYGEERLLRLNLGSNDMYPEWIGGLEEATGLDTGYRRCGTVMVARDADDNAVLEDIFRFQAGLGLARTEAQGPGVPRDRAGPLALGAWRHLRGRATTRWTLRRWPAPY